MISSPLNQVHLMKTETISLGERDDSAMPWLQSVVLSDQENIRTWKNSHASSFFYTEMITSEDQIKWFAAYLHRPDDFLFMVMEANRAVGCIGIRFRQGGWDIYNLIRGVRSTGSAGYMSQALRMVIEYAQGVRSGCVRADVITDNPALSWYLHNDFVIVGEDERSFQIEYQGEVVLA
jgi:RimJ/RimL family protein N-acetyltransferase